MSLDSKRTLRLTLRPAFRRRPLFWLALAASLGAWATVRVEAPLPLFLFAAVAGGMLAALRRPELAILLVAFGFSGLRTNVALAPPRDPVLTPGRMLTVRGTVRHAWGDGPDRGRRAILDASTNLEPGRWTPMQGSIGFFAEEPVSAGDALELSGVLERPLPPTQPGGRSERLDWARRGAGVVLDLRPQGMRRLGAERPSPLRRWRVETRHRLIDWNRRSLSPEGAIIANQFLIGDETPTDSELSRRIARAFRDSGTIHLLVVSGTQVSLALLGFLWLGARFYRARWIFWSMAATALAGYFLLTDGSPPVQRAAVMGLTVLAALALEREIDPENALGLAALALFALDPLSLFDLGFTLSFAAVWGLLRLTPLLYVAIAPAPQKGEMTVRESAWTGAWERLAGLAAASFGAFLATAPILAMEFQRLSWVSLVANIPMAAQATLLMYTATAHAFLGTFDIGWLSTFLDQQAQGLFATATFFAEWPGGVQPALPPPGVFFVLFLIAAAALAVFAKTRAGATLSCVALIGVLAIVCALPSPPPRAPMVRAFDVGQGDSLLLEGSGGGRLLVDAGPPQAGERLVRALGGLRVSSLDAVMATHIDADHVGGIPHLLRSMPVGTLLYHDDDRRDPDWQAVLAAASERNVPLKQLRAGQRLTLGSAVLEVLGPMEDQSGFESSTNDRSLVARWECGPASVLLTGDSGGESEARLLRWGPQLQSDVLKVGHHGSASSTSSAFLEAVAPEAALILCGRNNRYGHPSGKAMRRLGARRLPAYRTDRSGMLTVTWAEGSARIATYLRER